MAALTRHSVITTHTAVRPDDIHGQPMAELVHDALIRDWSDLRDWVAQDQRSQLWLHRTTEQAARHTASGLPEDLLAGSVLAEGLDWARQRSLPADITTLLAASRQRQQAAIRRARRINISLAGLLALALCIAGVAFWQRQTAVDAQYRALARLSQHLAVQSDALIGSQPDLASLLAIQAYRTSPTAEAAASLSAAAALPLQRRLTGHTDTVEAVAFSPDGKTLAIGSDDETVRLWDATTGTPRETLTGHTSPVASVAFNPDGKTLATSSGDMTIRWWSSYVSGAEEAEKMICSALRRDFTKEERSAYLGGQAATPVCT